MTHHTSETQNYPARLATAKAAIRTTLNSCEAPLVTTKFNEDSAVILHMVSQIKPDIPVVWVDTGYNTPETLRFAKQLTDKLDLSLHTFKPSKAHAGSPPMLYTDEHADFVNDVKIEPFERAMKQLRADGWISSIRRYQTGFRKKLQMFDRQSSGLLKTSPLLEWSEEDISRYLKENGLPIGPECVDPTKGNHSYQECGLHYTREPAVTANHNF